MLIQATYVSESFLWCSPKWYQLHAVLFCLSFLTDTAFRYSNSVYC